MDYSLHSILGNNPHNVMGRSMNASATERGILLTVIGTHLGVLDARDNDSRTLQQKCNLWDKVTRDFNNTSGSLRSKHQIQTLYKNMKAKAKKYQSRIFEAYVNHVPAPEYDPVSEILLKLLGEEKHFKRASLEQATLAAIESSQQKNHIIRRNNEEVNFFISDLKQDMDTSSEEVVVKKFQDLDKKLNFEQNTEEEIIKEATSDLTNNEITINYPLLYKEQQTDVINLSKDEHYVQRKRKLSNQSSDYSDNCTDDSPIMSNFLQPFSKGNKNPIMEARDSDSKFPKCSSKICCPMVHDNVIMIATEEHNMIKDMLLRNQLLKEEEHKEKMEIYSLKREYILKKIQSLNDVAEKTS